MMADPAERKSENYHQHYMARNCCTQIYLSNIRNINIIKRIELDDAFPANYTVECLLSVVKRVKNYS